MTDAVLENMRNLSLDSNNTSAQESLYTFQTWVYGYHLKNSIVHRIACELELPWMTQPSATILQVRDYIRDESGVDFGTNAAFRGGGCSVILYFAETGDPERFSALGIEYEGMDLVREAMGLPEGTKPKWYECSSGKAGFGWKSNVTPLSRARDNQTVEWTGLLVSGVITNAERC